MLRLILPLSLLLALVACAPQPTVAPPTATSTPAPTHTPTLTPSPTATPTPTPLPHPTAFDEAFARDLIRFDPESNHWLVSVVQTADGGQQTVELILLPDTFDTHDDLRIKNPLAPYTVRALDEDGRPVTLIWNPEKAEFRLAYTFPALFEGVGSENPRLLQENLEKIPFIPIEDIQSGLAVQSLLSHILDQIDKGESLADILYMDPVAVRQNWQKLGGNSLLFELLPEGKLASLKAKGNDLSARERTYTNRAMKILPIGANVNLDGQNYFAFYLANFDPLDPQNPDPNDLSNWKFFLSIPYEHYTRQPVTPNSPLINWSGAFSATNPFNPYVVLYGDEKYQQNHPLLTQLLSIEGNDASRMTYEDDNLFYLQRAIPQGMRDLGNLGNVLEMPVPNGLRLPPQLQQMIFLFEVGVAQ